jgi:hypothetical protein
VTLSRRALFVLAALAIILLSLAFYWAVLFYTRGRLSLPLDDSFIYFQLAGNTARGHIMEWTAGGGFSSAATSPLYVFILAAGYAAGLQGDLLILWALVIGTSCFAASFFLLAALGRRLLPADIHPAAVWLAPLLFILSGTQAWAYLSGMETGLFALVMLAALLEALRVMDGGGGGRPWRLAVLGGLLSLLRPEGLFLSLMLAGVLIWRSAAGGDRASRTRSAAWLLMAAPGILWILLVVALTGQSAPAPVMQKSYLFDPQITPYLFFANTFQNIRSTLDTVYLGGHSPPLFAAAFCVGLLPVIYEEIRKRLPGKGVLMGLWFFVGGLSTMMSIHSSFHHFRYQIPFFNIYLLCGSLGMAALFDAAGRRLRPMVAALAGFFILVQLLGLPRWIDTYGMNSKNIFDQQIAMGKYIAENLPEDATVGLNDAGAIPYYSGRKCFDIVGLGTEGQSRWYRSGPGSVFEGFERLSRADLPGYFAVYPAWWFNPDILAEKIHDINLPDNTICGDAYKALFRADWSILGSGSRPLMEHAAAGKPVDSVDVADLDSEKTHAYRGSKRTVYTSLPPIPGLGKMADGGRKIPCRQQAETMTVSFDKGKSLVMVGRFLAAGSAVSLGVTVNGAAAGTMEVADAAGWQEPELVIEAPAPGPGEAVVRIDCSGQDPYHSYHYWFYHKD